jgi:F420H(2)-dependent quinone reductase
MGRPVPGEHERSVVRRRRCGLRPCGRSERVGAFRKLVVVSLTGSILRVHEQLYKRTDGRVGHRMIGVPTLLLRTTGRRSGAIRTNGLVYARDGDEYLVVASNGGADRHPAWLHNVQANPAVEIQIGRQRQTGTAKVIEPSDPGYQHLWEIVNANNHDRYTAYQQNTARPIPVVVITPS